jgi:hypothetical protein
MCLPHSAGTCMRFFLVPRITTGNFELVNKSASKRKIREDEWVLRLARGYSRCDGNKIMPPPPLSPLLYSHQQHKKEIIEAHNFRLRPPFRCHPAEWTNAFTLSSILSGVDFQRWYLLKADESSQLREPLFVSRSLLSVSACGALSLAHYGKSKPETSSDDAICNKTTETDFTLNIYGTNLFKECSRTSRKHTVFLLKKSVTFREAICPLYIH